MSHDETLTKIFKAYDVRGLVNQELTVEVTEAIGQAFADFLPKPGAVAVGYDMRPDSAELAEALKRGLLHQGRDVIDIGQVTSDMIYFAVGSLNCAGGAMVTASHNPGQYNGIKLCGYQAAGISIENGLAEIRDAIIGNRYRPAVDAGTVTKKDIIDAWVDHTLRFVDARKWPAYRVAVDAGNGMAGAIIPHLVGHVPLKITAMYFELDGTFPNHPASPIEPENLRDLVDRIAQEQLDFGIAFDGDGDRAFLVDDLGRQVTGTIMTAMIAEATLKQHPGATILYNAICGRVVPETIARLGGKSVRTKVGHSFIKADMRRHNARFAGEHSGHYYFQDNYSADSGLIAALVAIDVLAQSGLKLSELLEQYQRYTASGELNYTVADKQAKIEQLATQYADGKQDRLDGLTVNYPDWWFNVRPSNTEPLLRLNVEGQDAALVKQKTAELAAVITQA